MWFLSAEYVVYKISTLQNLLVTLKCAFNIAIYSVIFYSACFFFFFFKQQQMFQCFLFWQLFSPLKVFLLNTFFLLFTDSVWVFFYCQYFAISKTLKVRPLEWIGYYVPNLIHFAWNSVKKMINLFLEGCGIAYFLKSFNFLRQIISKLLRISFLKGLGTADIKCH